MIKIRSRSGRVRSLVGDRVQFERGSPSTAHGAHVAVIAHWSVDHVVTRSVLTLVGELQSFGYRVVVVSSSGSSRPLDWSSRVDVDNLVVIRQPNVGYDFGSWSVALGSLPDLITTERTILANDSMVGPFRSLRPLLRQLDETTADVWGLTDTQQFCHHLQSYFLGFCNGVLADPPIQTFWSDIREEPDKIRVILRNEVGLGRLLHDEGYVQLPAFPHELFVRPGENPVVKGWKRLLEDGFPFLKRQILREPSVAPEGEMAPSVVKQLLGVDVADWVEPASLQGVGQE